MWQVIVFIAAWLVIMAWGIVGNYAYFTVVLPGLSRAGSDSSLKFLPWKQLKQVDQFLAHGTPAEQRSWVYGFLRHIRICGTVASLALLVAFMAALSLWSQLQPPPERPVIPIGIAIGILLTLVFLAFMYLFGDKRRPRE